MKKSQQAAQQPHRVSPPELHQRVRTAKKGVNVGQHVHIRVITNSKKTGLQIKDEIITARISSAPEKGKANKELIQLLEKITNEKPKIIQGKHSKKKTLEFEKTSIEELKKKIRESCFFFHTP